MTTSVTAEQIAQLRRMTNEPDTTTYSDALITTIIEKYPLEDELGMEPYYYEFDEDGVPERVQIIGWIPTYDLNAAAADIWEEKAAPNAQDFDMNVDGGSYTRSQAYEQAMKQARFYRSRRSVKQIVMRPSI